MSLISGDVPGIYFYQSEFCQATVSEETLKKKQTNVSWNQSYLRLDETGKDVNFKFLFPKEACLVA